jgi:hypothetical protein
MQARCDDPLGRDRVRGEHVEAMGEARDDMEFVGNPTSHQAACVLDALVSPDVEVADFDIGLWQAGKIGGVGGCRVRHRVELSLRWLMDRPRRSRRPAGRGSYQLTKIALGGDTYRRIAFAAKSAAWSVMPFVL